VKKIENDEMTEKHLLIDIISNAKNGSIWKITGDSWECIPQILPHIQLINEDYEWQIKIDSSNKNELIKIIDEYDMPEKVVHQVIVYEHEIVFQSYDNMSISFIKSNFSNYSVIRKQYQEIELHELKE
jgi:hypothetical protein